MSECCADAGASNLFTTRYRRFLAGTILAWAGEHDEAVTLLEQCATVPPVVGPAVITRDPLISIPLEDHPRYQALEKRLEAQIAENQKHFAAAAAQ
jgi:hypothetical protein